MFSFTTLGTNGLKTNSFIHLYDIYIAPVPGELLRGPTVHAVYHGLVHGLVDE